MKNKSDNILSKGKFLVLPGKDGDVQTYPYVYDSHGKKVYVYGNTVLEGDLLDRDDICFTIFDKISCNTLDQNRFSTALVYGRPFKIEDDCDRQKCEKKIMRLKGVLSEKKEKALEIFGIDVKEVVF